MIIDQRYLSAHRECILHTFDDIHAHSKVGRGIVTAVSPGMLPDIDVKGWFSVGIHPWDTMEFSDEVFEQFLRDLDDERVVAVGECGLDALRGAPLHIQEEIFLRQAHVAAERRLPVIIHCVKAVHRLLALAPEAHQLSHAGAPWILHGFRGKNVLAHQLVSRGIGLSLGKKSPMIRDVASEFIYSETDE